MRLLVFTLILNALLSRKVQTRKATESYKLQQTKGFYLSKLFFTTEVTQLCFLYHLCVVTPVLFSEC